MWPITALTKKLGIMLPIIQAPMAGISTAPELIAAVSNSGGLGSLGAGYMHPEQIRSHIQRIRQLTNKPFAVNLFIPEPYQINVEDIVTMHRILQASAPKLHFTNAKITSEQIPDFSEQMQIILEEKIPVFSFTFGIPETKWIQQLKQQGTLLIGTATNLDEALQLEEAGIDFIVAQGSEAGGHRGSFSHSAKLPLFPCQELVTQLANYTQIPIIAAGGIMTAEHIIAALKTGATAVQMGTAFLACPETNLHPAYKKLLLESTTDNTVLTRAFSGKYARGINNAFIEYMLKHDKAILDYPVQNILTRPMRTAAAEAHCIDYMSLWAGQAAHLCQELLASELIRTLTQQVFMLLK